MNVEPGSHGKRNRKGKMLHGVSIALAGLAVLCLAPTAALAAGPGGAGMVGKKSSVTLESIEGSTAKRVILSAKAAERLGIETGKVGEEPVVRRQMVSGLVIPPMTKPPKSKPAGGVFGGFVREAAEPSSKLTHVGFGGSRGAATESPEQHVAREEPSPAGGVWVRVTLSPAEWDRLAKGKPARLLPLETRDKPEQEVWAKPSGLAPMEDMKRSMLSLYYVVSGRDHRLRVNERIRVELELSGSGKPRKVVPYSAVYYDGKGDAWVYVNTKPLAFERERVSVERVVGDLAVLSDGPSVGTPVVTVGAALLFGAEIFGK